MTKNILIVEDEKSLQQVLKKRLEKEPDFRVFQAMHGEEGLKILGKEKIDLILLDVIMPVMDGAKMLKEIRQDEKLKDIKVIILTNSTTNEKLFGDPIANFLVKSNYTLDEVVEKVKEMI